MQKKVFLPATALLAGPAFAGLEMDWPGLTVTAGLSRVTESNSQIFGVHNREGSKGSIQTQSFSPKRKTSYSVGAEYLWSIGSDFALGPGIEYNVDNSLERDYGNNMLKRRVSAQREVYENISNIPVYLSMQHHFKTTSSAKPFVFGRLGYSINRIGSYSMTLYEEGLLPTVQPAVEAAGSMVTRTSKVRDLENSPYLAIGMGIRIKDRYSIQALYSYTKMRFRVFYPTSYTYYNSVTPTAYVTESFQVIETHDLDYSQVHLIAGFTFGGPPHSQEKVSIAREQDRRGGFNLVLGINKNLPMTSKLTHINATVINRYGEAALSTQHVVQRPVEPLSASIAFEYSYPAFRQMDLGIGVLYNFKHSYEKVQTSATGGYTQTCIENFTNTVPYLVGRYFFGSDSNVAPYVLGRFGYSTSKFDYNKYANEAPMDGVSAADIKGGLYVALGMGSRLSRHLFTEITYDVTQTGHKKPAYNGDSEQFETIVQGLQFRVGYNF